ncbi:hypothetical protein CRV01_04495 [Arcobacter sp. CECT 8983]|uniref:metal ABC transporter solute-binding protein, Zn/Mn family n=1 Tax=Arcobacter sp. CECT 8983 TaxID=2044508 RepID=UPI00100A5B78|nr:zinc ABC transporter substrate-binding protein [Arcobacter sp. CECT 8983]RXJ90424.1 hypothetical protein CRV01_04495 [Arcobacter sp. CECT 8983]
MIKYIIVLLSLLSFLHAKSSIVVTYPVFKEFIEKISKDDFFIKVIEDGYESFEKRSNLFKNEIYYSDVYLTLGLEEEKKYIKLLKKKNRYMKIIDVSKGIKKDIVNGKVNHYIWTDPLLVRELVKNLYNTLSSLKSYRKEFYEINHKIVLKELDNFFLFLKKKFDRNEFYNIYVYDSYWHYIAKRYRLNLYYKEDRFTKLEEVPKLIDHAQHYNIKKVLIKEGTSYEQAQSLASHINADIVEHDITKYNWKVNLESLARKIARYKENL